MDRKVEICKEEVPGSKRSVYGYVLTLGLKRRTFKLRVLNRWDFNFRVRISPLRGAINAPISKNGIKSTLTAFFFFLEGGGGPL